MATISKWTIALSTLLLSAPALAGVPIDVPEPAALGLMAVGVAAVVATTFRKRK